MLMVPSPAVLRVLSRWNIRQRAARLHNLKYARICQGDIGHSSKRRACAFKS